MAHHRCTRCKEEAYPRHKRGNGVYCDSCLPYVDGHGYGRPGAGMFSGLGSFIRDIWTSLRDFVGNIFGRRAEGIAARERESVQGVRMKAQQTKAMSIPGDPATGVPQKR